MAGVQVSVLNPTYVPVYVTLDVTLPNSVRQSDADILLRQTLLRLMDYARVPMGAKIYASDLISAITSLGSVTEDVTVTRLNVSGPPSNDVDVITAAEDEILVLANSNIEINFTGGVF